MYVDAVIGVCTIGCLARLTYCPSYLQYFAFGASSDAHLLAPSLPQATMLT